MKNFFLNIYRYLRQHRAVLWGVLALLTLLCVLSALRINVVEDISGFLPRNKDNERINYAYEHIGASNKIMVYISQTGEKDSEEENEENIDYELLCSAADRFAELFQETSAETCYSASQNTDQNNTVETCCSASQNTDQNNSVETCYSASLLYQIDQQKIDDITAFVIDNMPYFLTEADYERMDTLLTAEYISEQLANDKLLLSSPMATLRTIIQKDPFFFSANILQSLNNFRPDNGYHVEDGYIFNKEGNEAIIVITSPYPVSETQNNAKLIQKIKKTAHEVEEEFKHQVHISSFGAAEVSITNAQQIKKDSFLAISLSLLLIVAILIYYYRNARSILLILLSTFAGGLFALGLIAIVKNPVSLIAIGVASIIIGIAINYPIHFLSHFKRTDDKEQIIKDIAMPLLTGNITTVGAFISLMFISSDAMKDLGLFAALLLVGTILFVLIFLPHLLGKHYPGKDRQLAFKSVAEFRPEKHGLIMLAVIVLTIVFFYFSRHTSFDTNMHHINYMTEEQKQMFQQLVSESDTNTCTVYCIAEGNTLDEALEYNEKINVETHGRASLQQINGIGNFMPSTATQQKRLERWNQFWRDKKETFFQNLDKAAAENGFSPIAFQPCKNIIDQEYETQNNQYFSIIKEELAANYISEEKGHCLVYNLLKVNKNDASSVERKFNELDDHIFAFTDSSIASRLVSALSQDFDYVLFICGFIVFTFLLISFGRLEISLMAFTPLIIAWIWILGIMGLTGIRFNIVNIILATFIFGMGDDYSIFVTEGLSYEYRYGRSMLSQFKNSIILSSSIMFIGIGMLIFAKHPAMKSLAEVTIIGMLSVVLMAYIIPPFIFKWLTQKKGKLRKQPVTIANFFRTIFAFSFFICGTIFMSMAAFFLLTIGGKSEKHKQQYHKLLQNIMRFIAWGMPQVSYRVDNPHGEDFSKPAVIVCNHQSHFDLVYTLMLSPKIIALTNKWVWNFPLYRGIVRGADFLPVTAPFCASTKGLSIWQSNLDLTFCL